jgi:hypothetical protein
VRPGNILQVDGKLLLVHKFNHAQGAARALGNVTLELRDVVSRSKHSMRVRPSDALEVVRLEEKRMQCLYLDGARGGWLCAHAPPLLEQARGAPAPLRTPRPHSHPAPAGRRPGALHARRHL